MGLTAIDGNSILDLSSQGGCWSRRCEGCQGHIGENDELGLHDRRFVGVCFIMTVFGLKTGVVTSVEKGGFVLSPKKTHCKPESVGVLHVLQDTSAYWVQYVV